MTYEAKLVESHVDYITTTTLFDKLPHPSDAERGWAVANDILEAQGRAGNKRRPARVFAFEGYVAGQCFVGQSEAGYMVRLSGRTAARHWQDVFEPSTNVSRLDCAATVRLDGVWRDLSRVHHDEALRYQAEHNPRLRVTRIDGGRHGNTLNIGSRSSDSYCRIYDKERESKSSLYANCWRYEVEYKKEAAQLRAAQLNTGLHGDLGPSAMVRGWLARRGMAPVWSGQVLHDASCGREATDVHRKLSWVGSQVKPGLPALIAFFGLPTVLETLGLSDILPATAHLIPAGADSTREV